MRRTHSKAFRDLGVQKVAPSHCSGDRCRELFEQEYKENYIEGGAGKKIPFELALTRRRKLRTSGHVECSYGFGYGAAISEELLFPLLNRDCCLLPQGNADYQGNQR
jgi:hypothetical protein